MKIFRTLCCCLVLAKTSVALDRRPGAASRSSGSRTSSIRRARLVARRQDGRIPLGRRRQTGLLRRHARAGAGGAHGLPGRSAICASRISARFAWISDDEMLFGKDGQLWTVSPDDAKADALCPGLSDAGNFALSPDRKQIAFVRGGQIWLASLAAKTQRQLTHS